VPAGQLRQPDGHARATGSLDVKPLILLRSDHKFDDPGQYASMATFILLKRPCCILSDPLSDSASHARRHPVLDFDTVSLALALALARHVHRALASTVQPLLPPCSNHETGRCGRTCPRNVREGRDARSSPLRPCYPVQRNRTWLQLCPSQGELLNGCQSVLLLLTSSNAIDVPHFTCSHPW
jgi:hypothetical protein